MEQTLQNIRFAFRTLRKNRAFSVFAILTLGLGIGANTAIFSVIDGVLLKPLPYASGERLLLVRQSAPLAGRANTSVSIKELYDYREQTASFDALVEYHQMNFDLLKQGEPDRVNVGVVSHDFFNVLGISPLAGRTFVADDDKPGADAVLVLSHSYWMKAFGGDRSVVGRVFQMNDRPHTVVPSGMHDHPAPTAADVEDAHAGFEPELAADQVVLRGLRGFEGDVGTIPDRAGVRHRRAEHDPVERVRHVVVVGDRSGVALAGVTPSA